MSLLQTSGRLMMILSPLGAKNRPTITNHSLKLLMDCRKRVTWPAFVIFPGVGTAYIMCLLLPV